MEVDKTLNTADFLPTVLNLLGIDTEYNYLGQDAFDPNYQGYAIFSNGSWISEGVAYSVADGEYLLADPDVDASVIPEQFYWDMYYTTKEFIHINNLMLETDYYGQ